MFENMPTKSSMEVWNNDYSFGVSISFMEEGFGFGEIYFAVNKETGEATFENEEMGLEHCAEILERTVGTTIEHVEYDL